MDARLSSFSSDLTTRLPATTRSLTVVSPSTTTIGSAKCLPDTIRSELGEIFCFSRFSNKVDNSQILFVAAMQGDYGKIISWNTTTWTRIGSMKITREAISALAVSPDGTRLAIIIALGSKDMQVLLTVKKAALQLSSNVIQDCCLYDCDLQEFGFWGSDLNIIVYQGDTDSRKCIQAHEMYSSGGKPLFDALVTSYEFVQIDKAVLQKFKWSTIVIDEAHRLKKLDCNLAACLKRYSSEFRLLLTGTPLQNNLLELFLLLHYIDPDEFSDPKTDELFSSIESGRDLTMQEKIARIHDILKPRMLRRMKSDVTDSMPTKKWVEVPCALTDCQRELYINILEKRYSKLNSAIQNVTLIGLFCFATAVLLY